MASYVPVFHQLGTEPVKTFDESLFALRAYWLAEHGEYLNNFKEFPNGPSATNLKTPLFSGVQALSFLLLGYTEFALRLPVALMVLAIFFLMYVSGKYIVDPVYGWASILVLLASWGFFHAHAARTGAHDVPLSFFLLLSAWSLYRYVEAPSRKWLWMVALATWAAMMTKGVAGAFWLPAFAVYLSIQQGWRPLLADKQAWLAMGTVLLLLVGYYAYREWDFPGFLAQLWKGELGGHYLRTHDGHDSPALWYVQRLATVRYSYWVWWLPLSWVMMLLPAMRPLRNWLLLMNLASLSQLLIISSSATKLEWYDVPMYAPMAMSIGAIFWLVWKKAILVLTDKTWIRSVVVLGLVVAIWLPAYVPIFQKNLRSEYLDYPGERFGGLMKQGARIFPDLKEYTLFYSQFSTHCLFYRMVYNDHKGYDITRKRVMSELETGEVVMICEPAIWEALQHDFIIEPLTSKDGCYLAKLVARLPLPD